MLQYEHLLVHMVGHEQSQKSILSAVLIVFVINFILYYVQCRNKCRFVITGLIFDIYRMRQPPGLFADFSEMARISI